MSYISGFCGIGCHEGKKVYSASGKPMKVCTAHDLCTCSCHEKITKMYRMSGVERVAQPNPEYVAAVNVDLTWMDSSDDDTSLGTPAVVRPVVEKPSPVAPGLVESARTFAPTATGGRARGQLESEVLKVCNLYVSGHLDSLMTPKFIGESIDAGNPPSQGAIAAVLDRWSSIGYANVKTGPIRFVGFTVQGMRLGLEKMKLEAKGARRRTA